MMTWIFMRLKVGQFGSKHLPLSRIFIPSFLWSEMWTICLLPSLVLLVASTNFEVVRVHGERDRGEEGMNCMLHSICDLIWLFNFKISNIRSPNSEWSIVSRTSKLTFSDRREMRFSSFSDCTAGVARWPWHAAVSPVSSLWILAARGWRAGFLTK